MKKTTLFALLLICILTMPTFAKYSGGTGLPTDPYLISIPEDMNAISANSADWNNHFLLTNDIDMTAFIYTTALIAPDFDHTNWEFDGTPFTGVFDGAGFKVINLTIDTAGAGNDYLGLFGYTDSTGILNNLAIEDVNITGGNGSHYLGGLAGANDSTISNCFSTGSVTAGSNSWGLGGLVGYNKGTISDCFSTGRVTGHGSLGGLVGENYYGTINNCYATGSVNGGSSYRLGGLVGRNSGTIENSYATSSVTGGNNSRSLGGLVGDDLYGTISNCYSTGQVTGGNDSYYLGGLAGYNDHGTISNSYATGSVTGGYRSRPLGGLVGLNYGPISNCFSTGSVTGGEGARRIGGLGGLVGYNDNTISNSYATGSVTGGNESRSLGGLVGHNSRNFGTISDCFSTGSVTAGDGSYGLGGLAGLNGGTISDCYSTGSVTGGDWSYYLGGLAGYNGDTISDCYSTGSVTGGNESYSLGGLAGRNYYDTISNCYSTGQVTGGNDSHHLGGLAGTNWGAIINCFWDIQTSGCSTSAGGTGKTTPEMQIKSTFTDAGWDFTTPVWKICETVDYPRLAWEKIPAPVLYPEPDITTGTENTITWQEVNEAVEYYAICCNAPNLEEPILDSGWLDTNEVTFAGLDTGRTYYYAVKARQNCVMESDFSNVESSMQITLGDAIDLMLDPNSLKNANMANALSNKIDQVLAMIDAGKYQAALKKLENDILKKTDGCANTGQPDKNDWIETCDQQGRIYPLIMETIEYVESLMEE